MPANFVTPDQIVQADIQHPGNKLEEARATTLDIAAKVGGQWLRALGRGPAMAVIFESQGLRQAFLMLAAVDLAGERFPFKNRGESAGLRMKTFECLDLRIRPFRLR